MVSSPITSWQIDGETLDPVTYFNFLGSKIYAECDCSHEIKRRLLLCFLFYYFIFFSGFCHTLTWQPWIYMCSPSRSPLPPPSPSHPSGSSQCTSPEHLSNASNPGWWSVSPLIVFLFQCCSLRTSHPRLLPQSLKVCSAHLCLFFCLEYRVIITIF